MIQKQTKLMIADNSGGRVAVCIHVYGGNRRRYAKLGDLVLVTIKTLRTKRKESIKVDKGGLYKGVIINLKKPLTLFSGDSLLSLECPSIILLNKQNKIIGTRIFGSIYHQFRYTKYLKFLTLSSGSYFC